jgi:carboxyl-terminal processing protease
MRRFSKTVLFIVFFLGLAAGAFLPQVRALPEKIYKALDLFSKTLFLVEKDYVEPVDGQKLVYGAIKGMLGTLDPYTVFLTPDVYKELKVDTVGRFGGVGIEITLQDGILTVVTPIEDTPAARAGIKPGDRILKINGTVTKGMDLVDAVRRMRGDKNSKVVLTLYRQGIPKPFDVTLTREVIKIKSVKYETLPGGIAYIRVAGFQEDTIDELRKAVTELERGGAPKGVILDLRNNPGGLLDQAVEVSDLFLASGTIVSTKGRTAKSEMHVADPEAELSGVPIVILLNKGSASASEIVAGALQDNKRAKILGTQSFGKGSVQTVVDLGENTGLKLRIARYYLPSGKVIEGKGVAPDFIFDSEKTNMVDPQIKISADEQVTAAREYLATGKLPPVKTPQTPAKAEEETEPHSDM